MRISAKGIYAIQAMLELAESYEQKNYLTINEIADKQMIPHSFLIQILHELKHANLVDSRRGCGGGYRLSRYPCNINLGEVIYLIEGPPLPFKCTLEPIEKRNCPKIDHCVMKPIWDQLRESIQHTLSAISFEDLINEEHAINSSSPDLCNTDCNTG